MRTFDTILFLGRNAFVAPSGKRYPVLRGGDGPVEDGGEDDDALTLPADLGVFTRVQLRELHAEYSTRIAAINAIPISDRTLAQARDLRRMVAEANLVAGAVADAQEVGPVLSDVPEEPAAPVEPAEPDAGAGGDGGDGGDGDAGGAGGDGGDAGADGADALTPATMVAAVSASDIHVDGAGDQRSSEIAPAAIPAPFIASIGQQEIRSGSELSIEDIGEIMTEARRASLGDRRGLGKDRLFSLDRYRAGAQRLNPLNNALVNTALLATPQNDPRTAAICGPADIVRTIPNCVQNSRVIRDAFRQIPAERGRFQFLRSVGLADVDDGVAIWTDVDQAAVDPDVAATWKPCHTLVCADPIVAEVQAISSCLTVDTKQEFSAPEQIANNIQTLSAVVDRVAEGHLLAEIDEKSSRYLFEGNYGALPSIVDLIARQIGAALDAVRGLDASAYSLILEQGMLRFLLVDEASRNDFDACCADAVGKIIDMLGVGRVIVTPDAATGSTRPFQPVVLNPPGAPAAEMFDMPTQWRVRLLDLSAGFFFDTGEINFGIQRSPELSRQNRVQWFGEIFEGLDKQGCEPWFSTRVTLCDNGDRAGFTDPFICPPDIS